MLSKSGPLFELWHGFGQARSPRPLAQQNCLVSAWRHNPGTSSRLNMLPTSHAPAQPIQNRAGVRLLDGFAARGAPVDATPRSPARHKAANPSKTSKHHCSRDMHRVEPSHPDERSGPGRCGREKRLRVRVLAPVSQNVRGQDNSMQQMSSCLPIVSLQCVADDGISDERLHVCVADSAFPLNGSHIRLHVCASEPAFLTNGPHFRLQF